MYRITLNEAVKVARLFIRRAEEVQKEEVEGTGIHITGNKTSGAMLRASMELTRVLADLRQNR